jgi:dihydrofolate synthase / folylpolyglutamate synthase
MSYETAVTRMYELGHELTQTPSHKFDPAHTRVLLEGLGNPQTAVPGVLIAGTNGKGSTAATLASIAQASGLKTGLYTSPHLIRLNERIRVDGETISDNDFAALHGRVDSAAERLVAESKLPWHPSFFEMMTVIAFSYFERERVDLAVLEVGMGGRLDATNVIEPRISVITDISLDHEKYLGHTIREIAAEKAGILRAGSSFVALPQSPEANDVIGNTAMQIGAVAVSAVPYVPPVSPASARYLDSTVYRYPLEVRGERIEIETPLVGRHQLRNIALAVAAAEELRNQGFPGITPRTIEIGVRKTRWPGRFQVVPASEECGELVLDAAHNPAGAWALRAALSERYGDREPVIVFGAMQDKAVAEMTEILFPVARKVIVTPVNHPRSASAQAIQEAARRTGADLVAAASSADALQRAREVAGAGTPIVVTGSIYLIGEVMSELGIRP